MPSPIGPGHTPPYLLQQQAQGLVQQLNAITMTVGAMPHGTDQSGTDLSNAIRGLNQAMAALAAYAQDILATPPLNPSGPGNPPPPPPPWQPPPWRGGGGHYP